MHQRMGYLERVAEEYEQAKREGRTPRAVAAAPPAVVAAPLSNDLAYEKRRRALTL